MTKDHIAAADLIGKDWSYVFETFLKETDQPNDDGGGVSKLLDADNTVSDVKKLRREDMAMFGRCPETDPFFTVVCSICSMVLIPSMLQHHTARRHGNTEKPISTLLEKTTIELLKNKCKKSFKLEGKARKIKSCSTSPPDLTEETKRLEKKKSRSPEPPQLEPMTILPVRNDKRKQKLVVNPLAEAFADSQPIVALSPIKEEREVKVKKKDRKADKVYDANKHCGVFNDSGRPCLRSILCKMHPVALKRAVLDRSMPYDALIKIIKSQNEEERRPKLETVMFDDTLIKPPTILEGVPIQMMSTSCNIRATIMPQLKQEPPIKRIKIKEEEEEQYLITPEVEALIEETLNDEVNDELPMITPLVPKPKPILKWSLDSPLSSPPVKALTPQCIVDDVTWHSSHPKPLAVNTFNCRLIGGLMSTCYKLDTLRKHLHTVFSSSSNTMKNTFHDMYNNKLKPKSSNVVKKSMVPVKSSGVKRKRQKCTLLPSPTTNASDIISGLLVNPVQVQRSTNVPNLQPGVPLRLFPGSLPVIGSGTANQQSTYIQVNLCPPK